MDDQRYVRFATLGRVDKDDVRLAADIWLDDALNAPWASKETMKLAGILCRYMMSPNAERLNLKAMEDLYQLNADAARRALVLFSLYGMIEAYSTDGNELRAALRLSPLQTLRVLKTKYELKTLEQDRSAFAMPLESGSWVPDNSSPVATNEKDVDERHIGHESLSPSNAECAAAPFDAPASHESTACAQAQATEAFDAVAHAPAPDASSCATAGGDTAEDDVFEGFETVRHTTAAPAEAACATHARMPAERQMSAFPRRERATADAGRPVSGQDALALSLRKLQQRVGT